MTGPALPTLNMVSGVMFLLFPAASDAALVPASALTLPVRPRAQCASQKRHHDRVHMPSTCREDMRVGTGRGWHRPLYYESLREN